MFFRLTPTVLLLAVLMVGGIFVPADAQVVWQEQLQFKAPEPVLDVAYSLDGSRVYLLTAKARVLIYDAEGQQLGAIPVAKDVQRISAVGLQSAGIPEKLLLAGGDQVRELSLQFAVPINIDGAPFLGAANAPVTLVEFSDFLCPHCARVKPLTERLLLDNPGKLKVVFKNFVLPVNQVSKPAALAALAAQNQGKFWEMHDRIFAAQQELNPETIRRIAKEIGLDMNRFDRDLNSRELAARLETDIADGRQAGVRGTPALFINGIPVTQRSREGIQQMIDDAIKRQGR